jgi:hypothetical protein
MKWIGQHIYDQISRFRNHTYFEDSITLSTGKSITMDEYTSGTISITKIQDSGTTFNDNDTSLMTAAAVADKIEAYGYSTTSGDITGVALTAGTGVDLTGVSGATGGNYEATIGVDVSDFMSSGASTNVLTATGTDAMQAEPYFTFRNSGNNSTLALLSNEDTGDLFSIVTTTHGATTISTNDDDAAAAHFKIAADGDILLEPVTGDLTMYNAVNGGNPTISLGSSATDRFEIQTVYNGSAQTIDYVNFKTYTTSSTSHDGRYIWEVDEVQLAKMIDSGFNVYGNLQSRDADATLIATDTTTSSATQGGKIRLVSDDDAVMGDNHRLGVIQFEGAEDAGSGAGDNTHSIGARIQAVARDAWDGSNNDADLEFYTTDGTTESKVLTLDADKLATFTGAATITGLTTLSGNLTFDSVALTAIQTATEIASSFGDNDTSLLTAAAIDDRIRVTSKHVLRCTAFYVNDVPLVQNSLYFGSSTGNTPYNWNDPTAVGGVIGDTSSFTIIGDDENWGILLPVDISKIEVQCSLRPSLGTGDDFTLAVYTGVRSSDSSSDLTLTKIGHQSVSFNSTSQRYKQNDLTITGDYNAGTMIYVGVGSEDATDAKQARGYMNITVTER